jgi:hypothetical protein
MAALKITLGSSYGSGKYGSSVALSKELSVLTDAVDTAQALAEANGTIAGDGTALGLVQAIGTAFAAVKTALSANAVLSVDTSVVTSMNALDAVLKAARAQMQQMGTS